jgi:Flp pilus assembly protein TadG
VFASASSVVFTGGAQACNVFWQVSSSATLGTTSSIAGTILAHTSIVIQHGASLAGRALAETGNVTLDANSIQRPACASSGGSSAPVPVPGPPDRALYCSPSGQSYNLVKGEDKLPPYDALNLVPAYVNPVTGSVSCNFPSTVSTPATTTTTAASPPPPATTTTSTPPVTTTTAPYKPAPVKKTKAAVKAAKRVRVAHVAPKPARHQGGFTG